MSDAPERAQVPEVMLTSGEILPLEKALELVLQARFDHAVLEYRSGNREPLLLLGYELAAAGRVVYRIKGSCDDQVRDTLASRGPNDALLAGSYQASRLPGSASYFDALGLRDKLVAAGMDQDAADQLFELKVKDGRQLNKLVNRQGEYAEAVFAHTKRGVPKVKYERAEWK